MKNSLFCIKLCFSFRNKNINNPCQGHKSFRLSQ